MAHISFDASRLDKFVQSNELAEMQAMVNAADSQLREGTGAGNDFRGFLDLPVNYDKDEFARIKEAAAKIKSIQKSSWQLVSVVHTSALKLQLIS